MDWLGCSSLLVCFVVERKKAKFCEFLSLFTWSMRKMGKWGRDVDRRAHLDDRSLASSLGVCGGN